MSVSVLSFTGSKNGRAPQAQRDAIKRVIERLDPIRGVHGDCVGRDEDFNDEMLAFKASVHARPCDITSHRAFCHGLAVSHEPERPLDRNKKIVDDSDVLLAAPEGPEVVRSGTWSTIRYALKRGKHVIIVMPDGSEIEHNAPRVPQVNQA